MPYFQFKNIKISAITAAVPSKIVRGEDFYQTFGEEYVRKFQESTGVREVRKTIEHQTASDLAYTAAEEIFHHKDVNKEDIGALVYATLSLDYRRPSTACVLHKRLGLSKNCAAYDINLGCSAFVYGLQVVCSMMQSSDINKALLLVGETVSKLCNPRDKSVAMLFGDGGGAILLEKTDEPCEIKGILKTDGNGYQAIIAPAGGARNPHATTEEFTFDDGNIRSLYNTHMHGEDVFSFTISDVPRTIKEFFAQTETTVDDYDCFAFHQANRFIHQMLSKKLKIDFDKMPLCLDRFGNTSAPSIPLVICDRYGDIKEDKEISCLLAGFGVGLSWGVSSIKLNIKDIYPIVESTEIFEEGIINNPEDFLQE